MTVTTSRTDSATGLTARNRQGLLVAALLGVVDIVSLAFPTPDGETGPPLGIVILGGLLGIATVALVVRAWRTGSRKAIRGIAALRVLSMISALPAFFVDVPAWVKVVVAVLVLLTLVSVVLMLSTERRTSPITD